MGWQSAAKLQRADQRRDPAASDCLSETEEAKDWCRAARGEPHIGGTGAIGALPPDANHVEPASGSSRQCRLLPISDATCQVLRPNPADKPRTDDQKA